MGNLLPPRPPKKRPGPPKPPARVYYTCQHDYYSIFKPGYRYAADWEVLTLVVMMDEVAIVEKRNGQRFSIHMSKIQAMNQIQQSVPVKIIEPGSCKVHGWTVGGVYPTIECEPTIKDANGLDVRVMSPNWKRPVWLSSTQYQLVKSKETA